MALLSTLSRFDWGEYAAVRPSSMSAKKQYFPRRHSIPGSEKIDPGSSPEIEDTEKPNKGLRDDFYMGSALMMDLMFFCSAFGSDGLLKAGGGAPPMYTPPKMSLMVVSFAGVTACLLLSSLSSTSVIGGRLLPVRRTSRTARRH